MVSIIDGGLDSVGDVSGGAGLDGGGADLAEGLTGLGRSSTLCLRGVASGMSGVPVGFEDSGVVETRRRKRGSIILAR